MKGYTKEFIENNPDYKRHLVEVTIHFEGREIVKNLPIGSVKGRLGTMSVEGIYCKVIDQTELIDNKKTVYLERMNKIK